jgi:hypothetical protein
MLARLIDPSRRAGQAATRTPARRPPRPAGRRGRFPSDAGKKAGNLKNLPPSGRRIAAPQGVCTTRHGMVRNYAGARVARGPHCSLFSTAFSTWVCFAKMTSRIAGVPIPPLRRDGIASGYHMIGRLYSPIHAKRGRDRRQSKKQGQVARPMRMRTAFDQEVVSIRAWHELWDYASLSVNRNIHILRLR